LNRASSKSTGYYYYYHSYYPPHQARRSQAAHAMNNGTKPRQRRPGWLPFVKS
jgi:hypothetical protein